MYFDTHAHYDDRWFREDRESLLAGLPERGVSLVLNCGSDPDSSRRSVEFARQYPYFYAAVGIHPEGAAEYRDSDLAEVEALSRMDKVVAIGEIGLDYHYEDGASPERQKALLRAQLALAVERDLPVVIHDREAHEDCLRAVAEFPQLRGVFHCFSGSVEMALELTGKGWYLSFGGAITFKNARKAPEVVAAIPAERLLLETDCPYLAPVPHRGKRNDSGYLPLICAKIAEIRGLPEEEVARITRENGMRLFGIS